MNDTTVEFEWSRNGMVWVADVPRGRYEAWPYGCDRWESYYAPMNVLDAKNGREVYLGVTRDEHAAKQRCVDHAAGKVAGWLE